MSTGTQPRESFHYWVEAVTFASGGRIDLPKVGVTAIVGGNNVGKTTLLRDVSDLLQAGSEASSPAPLVLAGLESAVSGDQQSLRSWLTSRSHFDPRTGKATNNFSVEDIWRMLSGPTHNYTLDYFAPIQPVEMRARAVEPVVPNPDISRPSSQAMDLIRSSPELLEAVQDFVRAPPRSAPSPARN